MLVSFAHLSDPHLSDLQTLRGWQWFSKRTLGFLSWRVRRRNVHRPDRLAAVTAAVLHRAPQQIAVTGDLTQIGLPYEHHLAAAWLHTLGDANQVLLTLGNHDVYRADSRTSANAAFHDYLPSLPAPNSDSWPFVREVHDVAFIMVSTAEPRRWWSAGGRVGEQQRARLKELLERHRRQCRIVLIHHSPHPDAHPPRKALEDRTEVAAILTGCGAELVLHGHSHESTLQWLEGGGARIPVLGVASASATHESAERAGGYNWITVERTAENWQIHIESLHATAAGFHSHRDVTLEQPRPEQQRQRPERQRPERPRS